MNKTTKTILLIVLAVILVGGGVFVGMNWNQWFGKEDAPVTADLDENAEDYTGDREVYQGEKNTDTIDIPGFEALNMKAGTTEQSVNLYNPEQNTCYFKMSLILADGTVLWESDLVALGKAIYDLFPYDRHRTGRDPFRAGIRQHSGADCPCVPGAASGPRGD